MTSELRTQRLTLRQPLLRDAEAYARDIGNQKVARYLNPVPVAYSADQALQWISTLPPNTPDNATFVVELSGSGVIGAVALAQEAGYWIAESHWGHGYATEAMTALLRWHFTHSRNRVVASSAHEDNAASRNVQSKLGFVEIGKAERWSEGRQATVRHVVTELTKDNFTRRSVQ